MNLLFIVTRNEASLLRLNLAHHLAWGFDHALVADNESTDGTREVLDGFGDAVTRASVASPNDRFAALVALLARAEERHGPARWVAVSDTDEFWWGPGVDLNSTLRSIPGNILGVNAQQKLFLPTVADPRDGPIMCRRLHRTTRNDIPLHTSYVRGKSIYRAEWIRRALLSHAHRSPAIPPAAWLDLGAHFVHHYMIESEDAFVEKVRSFLGWEPWLQSLLDERRAMRDDEAEHFRFRGFKREWWDLYATRGEEGLRDYYRSFYVLSEPMLREHLASGDLVLDRSFADYLHSRWSIPAPAA